MAYLFPLWSLDGIDKITGFTQVRENTFFLKVRENFFPQGQGKLFSSRSGKTFSLKVRSGKTFSLKVRENKVRENFFPQGQGKVREF